MPSDELRLREDEREKRAPKGAVRQCSEGSPILVVGAPRSGTRMMSRVLGSSERHFLITEHRDKTKLPEERATFSDHQLWWRYFEFQHGRDAKGKPLVDVPRFDSRSIRRLRETYLELAAGRRLVIKNPANLVRLEFLRELFPNARYVYCVRNPWETIQSISIKGLIRGCVRSSFLLKSQSNLVLPEDMLLRAAETWEAAQRAYAQARNERWVAVRYEDATDDPRRVLCDLYRWLEIDDPPALEQAQWIPRSSVRNFFPLVRALERSAYREEILRRIDPGARIFGYDTSSDALRSDRWAYYRERLTLADERQRLEAWIRRLLSPHLSAEAEGWGRSSS